MRNQRNKQYIMMITVGLLIVGLVGCKKADDYLDAKRQSTDVVPTTLKDLQAVLDYSSTMNGNYPDLVLTGTDNAYLTNSVIAAANLSERNSYIFASDIFQGGNEYDWNDAYTIIEYANIVLDGLDKISVTPDNASSYNNIKGSALFYRSYQFFLLAQEYSNAYDSNTAGTDLGIPLRTTSDVNVPSTRATVAATYSEIITDLKNALSLLPVTPAAKTRPSQPAVNALLAKVYLTMADYTNALNFASACLTQSSTLLDYNNTTLVSSTSTYRFPTFQTGNPEVIFYATGGGYSSTYPNGKGFVDTTLYKSYSANDLRRTLYYKQNINGLYQFFGNYTGTGYVFSGLGIDEVYFIRAECSARAGNTADALSDLNTVLSKRWKTGTYMAQTASTSTAALNLILNERRKEFPFTGIIRWEDLKRLNKDPNYAVTVVHNYNNSTYTLAPNDNKYAYPLPDLEIQQYGLQQNQR